MELTLAVANVFYINIFAVFTHLLLEIGRNFIARTSLIQNKTQTLNS